MASNIDDLIQDLDWVPGTTNRPGVHGHAYCISKRFIVGWPTASEKVEGSKGILATLKDSFTLLADHYWHKVDINAEASTVESETQGVYPSISRLNKATLKLHSSGEDVGSFDVAIMNDDLAWLIPTKNGKYRLVGHKDYLTSTTSKLAVGSKATDESGTTLEVSCTDLMPAPFYEGDIEISDLVKTSAADLRGEPEA